jgi:hypothetical protein
VTTPRATAMVKSSCLVIYHRRDALAFSNAV